MDAAFGWSPDVWTVVDGDGERSPLRRIDDDLHCAESDAVFEPRLERWVTTLSLG